MEQQYFEDKTFEKINYTEKPLLKGEYENCTFVNCDFYNSSFTSINFIECEFVGCNLSMVKLDMAILRDVKFVDCKMLGLKFETCNDFGFSVGFNNCTLNHSSFYKWKLKKTIFKNSHLIEVDFTNCDLSNAVFDNCDLSNAIFENTTLEKADFRTSFNYSLNPEINLIKKAKFSLTGIAGLLLKYDIEIDLSN